MKFHVDIRMNLNIPGAQAIVEGACHEGLVDTTSDITKDTKIGSPFQYGTNSRSIKFDVHHLDSEVYSTSGYGGYLEVGTVHMPARPYFRPSVDRHWPQLPNNIKRHIP